MKRLGEFLIPPDGTLVHRRVTSSIKFAVTHLYTWVKRDTMRVKCLAQEHNAVGGQGLEPGTLEPESNAPTIRSPRLPLFSEIVVLLLFLVFVCFFVFFNQFLTPNLWLQLYMATGALGVSGAAVRKIAAELEKEHGYGTASIHHLSKEEGRVRGMDIRQNSVQLVRSR